MSTVSHLSFPYFNLEINTEYRREPFHQLPLLNIMIFLTGQHHGHDVVLATLLATLRPTQWKALHQHAMGNTTLACFGPIPWIDHQGVDHNDNKTTMLTMTTSTVTATAAMPTARMMALMATTMKVKWTVTATVTMTTTTMTSTTTKTTMGQ